MKLACLLIMLLSVNISSAEKIKQDTIPCSCSRTVNIKYPDVSEEDELEGTVIVEFEVDSTCFRSNPKVIQSLGTKYDNEALRVVNLMIAFYNNCRQKCRFSGCKEEKLKQPISFIKSD